MPNQHQNASKIFVCYQIQINGAHACEHSSGYRNALSVSRKSGLDFFFQNNVNNPNLGRSSDKRKAISVL